MRRFSALKRKLDYAYHDLLFSCGINKINPAQYTKNALIFAYHGVDISGDNKFNSKFISSAYFKKQIAYFKEFFHLVSLEEFYNKAFRKDKLNLCLTFDDGFLNNYKYAVPVLKMNQVPATFFITTVRTRGHDCLWADHIDLSSYLSHHEISINGELFKKKRHQYCSTSSGKSMKQLCKERNFEWIQACLDSLPHCFKTIPGLSDYWQLLDEKQLLAIDKNQLFTIGSHGEMHDSLGCIGHDDACQQLYVSKNYLESLFGHPITSLAYPDGSYSKELVQYAQSIGYSHQLAMAFLYEEDHNTPCLRERLGQNPYCSWNNQLRYLLDGTY